eukprot:GHVQ01043372.1.p1 GENE.GHVQ01043372.1~~GHVQ01043372.1.p1  ORF type:complete len:203 (+),score=23.45 GHVQ01043372.1:196-804(+)
MLMQYKRVTIDFAVNIFGFFIMDLVINRFLDPKTLVDVGIWSISSEHTVNAPFLPYSPNELCDVTGFHVLLHPTMTVKERGSAIALAAALVDTVDIADDGSVTIPTPITTDRDPRNFMQMVIEKTSYSTANVFVYAGPVKAGAVDDGAIVTGVLHIQYKASPAPELSVDHRFLDPPLLRLQQYCRVRDTYRKYKEKLDKKKG